MLVVIAQKEEMKLVEELGYENYPVLITGVGGINVVKALKNLPKDTEIMNIGYCGSNHFEVGTKVQAQFSETNHDIAEFRESSIPLNRVWNVIDSATCYTSTDFVTKTNKEEPCIFDMELAFIASMFDNVSAIKVVSDKLNYKQYKNNVE